jgi:hypothetical protein
MDGSVCQCGEEAVIEYGKNIKVGKRLRHKMKRKTRRRRRKRCTLQALVMIH